MRTVTLDGAAMQNKEQLHAHLHAQLDLPDYYGWNLDALYDALTAYDKWLDIRLINRSELVDSLGRYGESLVRTLEDAAEENDRIRFRVI